MNRLSLLNTDSEYEEVRRREREGQEGTGRVGEYGSELGVGGEFDVQITLNLPGFPAELIPPGGFLDIRRDHSSSSSSPCPCRWWLGRSQMEEVVVPSAETREGNQSEARKTRADPVRGLPKLPLNITRRSLRFHYPRSFTLEPNRA